MGMNRCQPQHSPPLMLGICQHTTAFHPHKTRPKHLHGSFSDDDEDDSAIKLEMWGRREKGRAAWRPIVELR